MAEDDEERRFEVGDTVKVRAGLRFSEYQPELSFAVGKVGDTREGEVGQEISVLYGDFGVYAQNVPAEYFELVARKRAATRNGALQ